MKADRSRARSALTGAVLTVLVGITVSGGFLAWGWVADRGRPENVCTGVGCGFDFGMTVVMAFLVVFVVAPLTVIGAVLVGALRWFGVRSKLSRQILGAFVVLSALLIASVTVL